MKSETATISFQTTATTRQAIKVVAAQRGLSIRQLLEPELRRIIAETQATTPVKNTRHETA